jgi:mannan endo-1,4-beta-mannosidase
MATEPTNPAHHAFGGGPWFRRLRLRVSVVVALECVVLAMWIGEATSANIVSTFPAGAYPRAIADDETTGRVFVTHQDGSGTTIFNSDGGVVGSLPAGTFGAAVDPATNRLYVSQSSDYTLRAFDLGSLGQVASVRVGPFPYAVAVNSNTNRIYVASQSSDGIYVVDGATASVLTNIPIPGWPPYGVAVNPGTNRIYASGINGGTVSVIDGATNSITTNISVGSQPNAIAANPETNRIYVTNQGSDSVSVIDGATDAVLSTIAVGEGPQAIDVNSSTNRVYVANTDGNSVSVIDGAANQVVQTIPVGRVPIGVAVNSNTNRVYVTNLHDHTVTILDDPPPPPPGVVTREGTRLLIDSQPYRPIGLNIYNANSDGSCWYQMNGSILDDSLTAIGPGKNAMRAWFFQDFATTAGVRDWTAFDRTLAAAEAHEYKVIVTLANQWSDCDLGYGYKDVSWYQSGYTQPDPAGIVSYRDWVQEAVSRYKNNPAILAWQLLNEPEVGNCSTTPESTAASILYAFASDVSELIKSIDRYHLVSLGTIGSGQCGASFTNYQHVMSIPTLDLCEYHDYTSTALIPGDQYNGLQFRIDQCNALNKPLLVGELGIKPTDVGGTLRDRANTVDSKLCAQISAGVAGELLWAWNKDGSTANNFDIGPGDPVLDVLGPWSDPTHICSAPSAPTGVVAAAGAESAAVSWLPPNSNGGSVIRSYTVTSNPGDLTTTVDGSQTSGKISGLTDGMMYTFTVAATNAAGTGSASQPSDAVRPQAGYPTPAAATASASPSSETTVTTGGDPAVTGGTSTSVTVPAGTAGGTVSVTQSATNLSAPTSYQLGDVQIQISAPAATAANPLTLVFTITPTGEQTLDSTQVYRTEAGTTMLVAGCDSPSTTQALPDPCVSNKSAVTINGRSYIQLKVLTSRASIWNQATPTPAAISVTESGYSPAPARLALGGTAKWAFLGKKTHSVTDAVGLSTGGRPLFNSGPLGAGTSYAFRFLSAGSYAYKSTVKGDSAFPAGLVEVPAQVTPAGGGTTTRFTVIWASSRPSGYVFDLRYRFKPAGATRWGSWATWKSSAAATSAGFVPNQGAGAYAFAGRLRNQNTGRASEYSPEVAISVS